LHRTIEELRETDFELAERRPMVVTGGAFGGRHRPWEAVGPAIEERLNVGRCQRIAGGVKRVRVSAGQEAVVEALEPDAIAVETLLHPLVAVETELHGIREIGPDLEKRGTPVPVVDVKVVVLHSD
jgi:hypothetical protein